MLKQAPFSFPEISGPRISGPDMAVLDSAGRPFISRIDIPPRRAKKRPATKSGTLRLDRGSYIQPHNVLPGITQLHLNENLFAAARAAVDKSRVARLLEAYLADLHAYPSGGLTDLRKAIGARLQVEPDKVVISHGSSALLRDVILYLLRQNDTLLLPAPSWSYYHSLVELVGARIDTFPLLDAGDTFIYDRRLIAAKIEAGRPKVVLICSPNNPTGNVMPLADFLWLAHEYPDVDFVFDEAYYGFCDSYSAAQEKALLDCAGRRNVFVIRTFSKFYGLANLRVGFLICSEADGRNLQNIAPVFGLPSLDQALAVDRLLDGEFHVQMRQEYAAVNAYVYMALAQIPGFTPYQTCANFILVQHDGRWAGLEETLLEYGYKIKRETINGARNYFRITYADLATMQKLVAVIRQLAGWQLAGQTINS